MYTQTLAQILASSLDAMRRCAAANPVNTEWRDKHEDTIVKMVDRYMPHGAGIDSGTKFDFDRSTPERLVFTADYHHMNESGYYDGWTAHTITVKASLIHGLDISIAGRNRNDIKDYLHETYDYALRAKFVADHDKGEYVCAPVVSA